MIISIFFFNNVIYLIFSTDESRPASAVPPAPIVEAIPTAPPVEEPVPEAPIEEPQSVAPLEQTTLLQNEDESFALPPVDASALRGIYYDYI